MVEQTRSYVALRPVELAKLYVDPHDHGQGVAAHLLHQTLATAAQMGYDLLTQRDPRNTLHALRITPQEERDTHVHHHQYHSNQRCTGADF